MITEQHNQIELLQERTYHQALGVLLNTPVAPSIWARTRAASAIMGLAARSAWRSRCEARLLYCCNQMHAVGDNGPRARRLIECTLLSYLKDWKDEPENV